MNGLTYGPSLDGWLKAGGGKSSHSPAVQRMLDGMNTPLELKKSFGINDLPKADVIIEINGKRYPASEAELAVLVEQYGEAAVMNCLTQIINDVSDKMIRRG